MDWYMWMGFGLVILALVIVIIVLSVKDKKAHVAPPPLRTVPVQPPKPAPAPAPLANASASGSWASVGHGNGKEQMMLMDRGLGGDYLSRQHMAHMAQMHGAGNPTWALSDIQLGDIVTPDQAKQIVRIVVVKSDHCGWCKKLQADVLDHVKAYYDIDVLTVQEAQAAQVPFDGQGVPQTIVFVNGAVKGTFKGYSPKDSWIAQVQKVIHGA